MSKPTSVRAWIRRWVAITIASCIGTVFLVLGLLWLGAGFHGLGMSPNLVFALLLGSTGTVGLCFILMGLVFYSEHKRGG